MLIIIITLVSLATISLTGLIISQYKLQKDRDLLIRNNKVAEFRSKILRMNFIYSLRHSTNLEHKDRFWFFDKYTYEDMLHSKKSLTLDKWYTEEELNRINS